MVWMARWRCLKTYLIYTCSCRGESAETNSGVGVREKKHYTSSAERREALYIMRSILEKKNKNKYTTKFTTRRYHRAPHITVVSCGRHGNNNMTTIIMLYCIYRVVAIAFGGCGRQKFIVTAAAYYKRSGRKPTTPLSAVAAMIIIL